MGQKIHPNGFRLGIVQKHLSNWFVEKKYYSKLINEDYLIREIVMQFFNSQELTISRIKIEKYTQNNKVLVYVSISSIDIDKLVKTDKEKSLPLIELLESILIKKFGKQKSFSVIPEIIKVEQRDAHLVGLKIVDALSNRIPFKRVIKDTIRECMSAGVVGIKIQVSGRLNGVEIARSEWRREGCVPLHTLKAKIDYSYQTAQTIYGIIGVKIWLFLGEDQSVSKKFV